MVGATETVAPPPPEATLLILHDKKLLSNAESLQQQYKSGPSPSGPMGRRFTTLRRLGQGGWRLTAVVPPYVVNTRKKMMI